MIGFEEICEKDRPDPDLESQIQKTTYKREV
jgi:hypothetical protein